MQEKIKNIKNINSIFKANINNIQLDLLSGITVAIALVPEAIAFAIAANLPPLVGLYAACIVCFITSVIGGRPGMISGATGALAVVMVHLVQKGNEMGHSFDIPVNFFGIECLFATVILMGIIQVLAGLLRLGKFIRMVPYPVMLGFVNGLAIVIGISQLEQFKTVNNAGNLVWMSGKDLYIMLFFVLLTIFVIYVLPKLTKRVPSTLVAIVVITAISLLLPSLELKTVKDVLVQMTGDSNATMKGGLPSFHIPNVIFTPEVLSLIIPYAFILASIGLIESLLTLSLIDDITETRGQSNRECIGQGVSNIITGFFGGMGGCAMIGQSMINIKSGGKGRLSGITAAVFLLLFILLLSKPIELIPIASLVGVMFVVVIGTFAWASLRLFGKVPKSDIFITATVTITTVLTDLAIAVIVGVIISALVFAWKHAKTMQIKVEDMGDKKIYYPNGPLFFGSSRYFNEFFTPKNDPENVIIDFANARVFDHSGISAIDSLSERYKRRDKKLVLRHLSKECYILLEKAKSNVEIDNKNDPKYHIADDSLDN